MLNPEIRKLHKSLTIAYSFYYATKEDKISLDNLLSAMIHDMKENKCDVATFPDI